MDGLTVRSPLVRASGFFRSLIPRVQNTRPSVFVSIDDLLFKSNVVGIVVSKPITSSGFWKGSEQFEMVDVANFLVRVDCATRIPCAERVIAVTQTLTTFAGQQWRGKGARDIIGEM